MKRDNRTLELKQVMDIFVTVTKQLIKAHREQSNDCSSYVEPLEELLKSIENESFYDKPLEDQSRYIASIRGQYLGKAELFRMLVPDYLEYSFMDTFREAYTDLVDTLSNEVGVSSALDDNDDSFMANNDHEEDKLFHGNNRQNFRHLIHRL